MPIDIDSGNTAWVLAAAALVMFMTPGLGFFYAGFTRSKNALATIMQSFIVVGLGREDGGGGPAAPYTSDTGVPHEAFMVFQAMFAIITPALITGAFAERAKFSTFLVFMLLWSFLVYD